MANTPRSYRVLGAAGADLGALLLDAAGAVVDEVGGDRRASDDGALRLHTDERGEPLLEVAPTRLDDGVAAVAVLVALFAPCAPADGLTLEGDGRSIALDSGGAPKGEASTALLVPLVLRRDDGWRPDESPRACSFGAPAEEARLARLLGRSNQLVNLLAAALVIGCVGSAGPVADGSLSIWSAGLLAIGLPTVGIGLVGLPLRAAIRRARADWRAALVARARDLLASAG